MTAAIALAAVPGAQADLRSTTLDSLLRDSQWITVARVESVTPGAHGAGTARLQPLQTLHGQGVSEAFSLSWSDEVHDQRVPPPPATVVAFLKRQADGFVAAHYGRSLWPLLTQPLSGSSCGTYAAWRYPLDTVRLSATQRQRLLQQAGTPRQPILCLDDFSALIPTTATRSPR